MYSYPIRKFGNRPNQKVGPSTRRDNHRHSVSGSAPVRENMNRCGVSIETV